MIYHTHRHSPDPGDAYRSFKDLRAVVRDAEKELRPVIRRYAGIVVTGVSGMSVGFPLALRLRIPIIVVRRDDEDCHASGHFANDADLVEGGRYLFLDDFTSGGRTYARVVSRLERAGAMIAGTYWYRDNEYYERSIA